MHKGEIMKIIIISLSMLLICSLGYATVTFEKRRIDGKDKVVRVYTEEREPEDLSVLITKKLEEIEDAQFEIENRQARKAKLEAELVDLQALL